MEITGRQDRTVDRAQSLDDQEVRGLNPKLHRWILHVFSFIYHKESGFLQNRIPFNTKPKYVLYGGKEQKTNFGFLFTPFCLVCVDDHKLIGHISTLKSRACNIAIGQKY